MNKFKLTTEFIDYLHNIGAVICGSSALYCLLGDTRKFDINRVGDIDIYVPAPGNNATDESINTFIKYLELLSFEEDKSTFRSTGVPSL